MSDAPERIYLEPADISDPDTGPLWCQENIGGYDEDGNPVSWVEYIRADITAAQVEALTKERDKNTQLLADQTAVHLNMLNGRITKPSIAQIEHIYPELTALRALLREAVKTLVPFAREAETWADTVPDRYRPPQPEPGTRLANKGAKAKFKIGDLRRARAVLAKLEALG